MAHFINKACIKCGACVPECPTGSITEGHPHYIIDSDTCCDFAHCVRVCPADAISPMETSKQKSVKQKV